MQRSRALGAAVALCAVFALTGCIGDGVAVNEPVYNQEYVNGELEYAARSGELRTNVYGTPFAGAGSELVAATTADMKGANRGPTITFTPTPKGEGSGAYHVVMLFNPLPWVSAYDICKDGDKYAAQPSSGDLRLLSAFCFNDMLVSEASGTVGGARSLGDPRFRSLVRQVTLSLFPAFDHKEDGGGDGGSPPG